MAANDTDALDLLERRWTLRILLELGAGPRRFSDLRRTSHGISANVLAARLRSLELADFVEHVDLPPPASCQAYRLTHRGKAFRPVLASLEACLGDWQSVTA